MTPATGCLALDQDGEEFFEGLRKILPGNSVEWEGENRRFVTPAPAGNWGEVAPMSDSLARTIDRALGEVQALGISIKNPSQVKDYLTTHIDTIDLVLVLSRKATVRFLKNSSFTLDLYSFEDEGGRETYLRLLIRQWPYEQDLLDRVQQIYEEEANLLSKASGWFQVTTDFRKP